MDKMDSLSGVAMFVAVAEARSFAKAAAKFGVSASAVGKSVARMEARLSARLFHRSTRSVALTAEGAMFLERCRRILAEVEAAEGELSDLSKAPRGKLRVSAPQLTGLLMPIFASFMRAFPEVELEVDLSERMVDLIDEGFDAVIRTGATPDSGLAMRKLGSCRQLLVAAPSYLARRGAPLRPSELAGHDGLMHRFPTTGKIERWALILPPGESEPELKTRLVSSSVEAMIQPLLQGEGIAFLPEFLVAEGMREGRLAPLMEEHVDKKVEFSLLWPASRHASPKLRAFIDHVVEGMAARGIRA